MGHVFGIGGVDVFLGGEVAAGIEDCAPVDRCCAAGDQVSDGRDIDLRAVGEDAVVIVDRRRGDRGQGQCRHGIAFVVFAGRLVAQADFRAELELVGVGEQLLLQQGVDRVGIFLVGIVVLLVGEAVQGIERGIVDFGHAVGETQDRVIGVRHVVIGEGNVLRAVELGDDVVVFREQGFGIGGVIVDGPGVEMVATADDKDFVGVRLALIGRLDHRLGGDQIAVRIVRVGGDLAGRAFDIVEVVIAQDILGHRLRIAGDIGPEIVGVVAVRLEIELAAFADANAMIVVAAQAVVGDRIAGRHAVVDIVFLDVVDGPAVCLVGGIEDERERRRV